MLNSGNEDDLFEHNSNEIVPEFNDEMVTPKPVLLNSNYKDLYHQVKIEEVREPISQIEYRQTFWEHMSCVACSNIGIQRATYI